MTSKITKLEVKSTRANIPEEQSERVLFEVFDLLLNEDIAVVIDKENRQKTSKN
jgi:hypothetical protein